MKKTLSLVALLFAFNFYFTQGIDEKDTVIYSVVEDNPEFGFFNIGVDWMNICLDNNAFPIGTGGTFNFSAGPIYGGADYIFGLELASGAYLGPEDFRDGCKSIYSKSGRKSDFESYIGYTFKEKKAKEVQTVKLKAVGKVIYEMDIDATVLKRYGVECGFRSGYSYYQSLNETNGFQAIPVNPYPGENADPFNLIASTVMEYNILNFGVSLRKQHDIVINTEEYGDKRSNNYTRLYARVAVLLNSNLDDVSRPTDGNWGDWLNSSPDHYRFNINDNTPMNKVGFNIGASYVTSPKNFAGFGKVELGYFPGPKVGIRNNIYFLLKGGFSFSAMFKK